MDSTLGEVKKQYRKLAMVYHPDKCSSSGVTDCEEKMGVINNAYETLTKLCKEHKKNC